MGKKMKKSKELVFEQDIDPSKFVRIPGTNIAIEKEQSVSVKTFDEFHEIAGESGLFVATPSLFMPHYIRARDAAAGKAELYDSNGRLISKSASVEIWDYLSNEACIFLNAKFVEGTGFNDLDLETKFVNIKKSRRFTERITREERVPLTKHVNLDGSLADLVFNKQGFPVRESRFADYKSGRNLYFYKPLEGCVAGFWANSDRSILDCVVHPGYSYAGLGVLFCAEGTPKNEYKRKRTIVHIKR